MKTEKPGVYIHLDYIAKHHIDGMDDTLVHTTLVRIYMMMKAKTCLQLLLLSTFLCVHSSGFANAAPVPIAPDEHEMKAGAIVMAADLIIARPLLLAASVITSATFIVSAPFSLLGGNIGEAGHTLVVEPLKNTFTRCLGCEFA